MQNFHLLLNNGMWNLTADGAPRPLNTFCTKEDALASTWRVITAHGGGALLIHATDGSVEEQRTYPR